MFPEHPMPIDPFYLILDSADAIERALGWGVRLVQLRIKGAPDAIVRPEILRARKSCAACGAQLVVNDHWRLAIDLGCAHVHLGQEDLQSADIKAIHAAGLTLGLSTETEEELEQALALGADCIALQPIFVTTSKAFDRAPQGLKQLRKWKSHLGDRPLVAIGGLRLEDADAVFQAGADSLAVISDVTHNPDPERRARTWVANTRAFARSRA
jgi:thiamine-phosphate pyrophosphorylase